MNQEVPFPNRVTPEEWDFCVAVVAQSPDTHEMLSRLELAPEQISSEIDKARMGTIILLLKMALDGSLICGGLTVDEIKELHAQIKSRAN